MVVIRNSSGNLGLPPGITPVRIMVIPITRRGTKILRGTRRLERYLSGGFEIGLSSDSGSPN